MIKLVMALSRFLSLLALVALVGFAIVQIVLKLTI